MLALDLQMRSDDNIMYIYILLTRSTHCHRKQQCFSSVLSNENQFTHIDKLSKPIHTASIQCIYEINKVNFFIYRKTERRCLAT